MKFAITKLSQFCRIRLIPLWQYLDYSVVWKADTRRELYVFWLYWQFHWTWRAQPR